jgi:hypothetical protein
MLEVIRAEKEVIKARNEVKMKANLKFQEQIKALEAKNEPTAEGSADE